MNLQVHQIVTRTHVSRYLQLGLGALASDGALDETVGVGLRGKHGGILASVLDSLVPAEVCASMLTYVPAWKRASRAY